MNKQIDLCPCSSGKEYSICCRVFHEGERAQNALQLMRSRYSAYACNMPEYIMHTTHIAHSAYNCSQPTWKKEIEKFSQDSIFKGLEILKFQEKESVAIVIFTAHIESCGVDATFTEKSYFEKIKNEWFYRSGFLCNGADTSSLSQYSFQLLPIAYYGNPILRKNTKIVESITSELRLLIDKMIYSMDVYHGMGISAPQVFQDLRLFVIRPPFRSEDGSVQAGPVKVFINPIVSQVGTTSSFFSEGCLSIPGVKSEIQRPSEVKVEYVTLEGVRMNESFSGLEARIIQHENDHLNGRLFIDYLDPKGKKSIAPLLKSIEEKLQSSSI